MFLDTPINNNNKYIVAIGIETVLLFFASIASQHR